MLAWANHTANGGYTRTMASNDDTRVVVRAPRKALQSVVKRILVVESGAGRNDLHLPDTGLTAAFRFGGECRLDGMTVPDAAISGLRDKVYAHAHGRDHGVVVVAFTATGAASWLRQPLDAFANATENLEDVLGPCAGLERLQERLMAATGAEERVRMVEELLLAQLEDVRPDRQVAAAVDMIERANASLRIDHVAREIGLSQSALERRFRRVVGASPRKFASLVRLQGILRLMKDGGDLTTVAHAAGYYDQSHFIKDFRGFTGKSPRAFIAEFLQVPQSLDP
jgi:AraC-like DNA-binding protein